VWFGALAAPHRSPAPGRQRHHSIDWSGGEKLLIREDGRWPGSPRACRFFLLRATFPQSSRLRNMRCCSLRLVYQRSSTLTAGVSESSSAVQLSLARVLRTSVSPLVVIQPLSPSPVFLIGGSVRPVGGKDVGTSAEPLRCPRNRLLRSAFKSGFFIKPLFAIVLLILSRSIKPLFEW